MDSKKLGIIGAIIIIIVIIVCAFAFLGGSADNPENAVSETNDSNSQTTNISGTSDADYKLQINTTGKWRLDLTVNGDYSSDEDEGSKTIDLGNSLDYASVTVNQYENGPTTVYLLKGNEILEEESSNGEGIETIYFYYDE